MVHSSVKTITKAGYHFSQVSLFMKTIHVWRVLGLPDFKKWSWRQPKCSAWVSKVRLHKPAGDVHLLNAVLIRNIEADLSFLCSASIILFEARSGFCSLSLSLGWSPSVTCMLVLLEALWGSEREALRGSEVSINQTSSGFYMEINPQAVRNSTEGVIIKGN